MEEIKEKEKEKEEKKEEIKEVKMEEIKEKEKEEKKEEIIEVKTEEIIEKNLKLNLKNKKMTDIKFSKENFIPFIKSSFTVKYEKKSTLGQGAFGVVYK